MMSRAHLLEWELETLASLAGVSVTVSTVVGTKTSLTLKLSLRAIVLIRDSTQVSEH